MSFMHAAAAAKSLQSCPTLCDPTDGSTPGSPIPGILQARTLEWVAISFSNAWKWKVKVKLLSRVWLIATPWTAAYQAPQSMGFSRQGYWSVVPLLLCILYWNLNNKRPTFVEKKFDQSIRTLLAVFVYIYLAYILIVVRSMIRKQYQEPQLSRRYVIQKATNVHWWNGM